MKLNRAITRKLVVTNGHIAVHAARPNEDLTYATADKLNVYVIVRGIHVEDCSVIPTARNRLHKYFRTFCKAKVGYVAIIRRQRFVGVTTIRRIGGFNFQSANFFIFVCKAACREVGRHTSKYNICHGVSNRAVHTKLQYVNGICFQAGCDGAVKVEDSCRITSCCPRCTYGDCAAAEMSESCIICPNVEYFARSNRRRQSKFDASHCVACFCRDGRNTLLSMQVFRIGFRLPPRRACNQVLGCDVLYLAAFCKADFRYVAAIYSQLFAAGRFKKTVIGLHGRIIGGVTAFTTMNNVVVIVDSKADIYRRFVNANRKRRCAFVINLQGVNLACFPCGCGVAVCIKKLYLSGMSNAVLRRFAVDNRRNPTVCFVSKPSVNSKLAACLKRSRDREVYRRTGRACRRSHIYTVIPGAVKACRFAFPYDRTFSKAKFRYIALISGEAGNFAGAVIGHVGRNRAYVAVCTFDIRNVKIYVCKRVKLYIRFVIVKIYVNRVNGFRFERICLDTVLIYDKQLSVLGSICRRAHTAWRYGVCANSIFNRTGPNHKAINYVREGNIKLDIVETRIRLEDNSVIPSGVITVHVRCAFYNINRTRSFRVANCRYVPFVRTDRQMIAALGYIGNAVIGKVGRKHVNRQLCKTAERIRANLNTQSALTLVFFNKLGRKLIAIVNLLALVIKTYKFAGQVERSNVYHKFLRGINFFVIYNEFRVNDRNRKLCMIACKAGTKLDSDFGSALIDVDKFLRELSAIANQYAATINALKFTNQIKRIDIKCEFFRRIYFFVFKGENPTKRHRRKIYAYFYRRVNLAVFPFVEYVNKTFAYAYCGYGYFVAFYRYACYVFIAGFYAKRYVSNRFAFFKRTKGKAVRRNIARVNLCDRQRHHAFGKLNLFVGANANGNGFHKDFTIAYRANGDFRLTYANGRNRSVFYRSNRFVCALPNDFTIDGLVFVKHDCIYRNRETAYCQCNVRSFKF